MDRKWKRVGQGNAPLDGVKQHGRACVIDVSASRLTIFASHDLALAQLRDRLARGEGLKLDLRFLGSLDSLAALSKGQCSIAGFHFAEGMEQAASAMFRRYLKPRQHKLIGLATRTQGLMWWRKAIPSPSATSAI